MESKIGSVLALISGILTIIVSVILFIVAMLFILAPSILPGKMEGNPVVLGLFLLFGFAVALVIGLIKLWVSRLMKNSETTTKGGIIILVVGIIGGGDLLAIIAGILGIVQGGKVLESVTK